MKIKLILIILALNLLISKRILGQTSEEITSSKETVVEIQPYPEEGLEAFYNYFEQRLQYPKAARKDKISGTVILSFVVDTTGKLTDFKIVKSVREDIDQEALRLISSAPDWFQAITKGVS
jgi:TonB family protein